MSDKNARSKNKEVKYSKTMEEVVKMLSDFQKIHGDGSLENRGNEIWEEGYARAVSDILFIIS